MKTLIIVLLVLTSLNSYAQLVVTSPNMELSLNKIAVDNSAKNASDSAFQSILKSLEKKGIKINENTFDEISKIQKGLENVNNLIKSSKDVIDIKNQVSKIANLYLEANITISKHAYISMYDKKISAKVNTIIMNDVFDKSKELTTYIKSNELKLSDFQRITLIKKLKNDLNDNYIQMNFFYKSLIFEANKLERKLKILSLFKNK
ncbi:hypothetical protein LNI89_11445 [Tenacibaculum dicentrarchi]|nr:hypothetical protein [Tenacibaculum dicentrarchi]MCD8421093.1 hypothetical protein [Tenacibaculum dicentrarchi]